MDIRSFNKQKDFKTLCSWWDDWGLFKHHQNGLSENGIIVSKDRVCYYEQKYNQETKRRCFRKTYGYFS